MESVLLSLKGSYMLVFIAIIFVNIMMYIDSFFSETKKKTSDYIKYSILTAIVAGSIVYICSLKGIPEEEIIPGPAPF